MINVDIDRESTSKDGRTRIAKSISKINPNPKFAQDERVSWQYYYGKQSENAYDYLLKSGDFTLPAKPRFFPKQRSYLNLLISTFELRPFVYNVNACNREAVKTKYDNRLKKLVGEMMTRAKTKQAMLHGSMESMQTQIQQLEQMVQQEPQNEEQAAQIQSLQQVLPQIKSQLVGIINRTKTEEFFTRSEIEKIERFYTYEDKDVVEHLAQVATKKLREKHNAKRKAKENFTCKLVGGRPYYYIDFDTERNQLVYETVNSLKVTYPTIENIDWVEDLPWVKVEEYMSPDSIISSWGHKLSKDQIETIRKMKPEGGSTGGSEFLSLPGGYAMDLGANNDNKVGPGKPDDELKGTNHGVKVDKIWWKAQRDIKAVQMPNKHKNSNFTHFIPDDRIPIPNSEYRYDRKEKMYVHKKDKEKTIGEDQAYVINDHKDEKIITRYVDDRYKAIVINDEIVISEKDPVQPRSVDDYSRVPLPIVGPACNNISNLPYSLMMITKGLADTYNLLHLHREIIMALSGVAGVLIDMSQKPDDMSKDEWFYQMKMGRMLIQTVRNGRQVSSFNQFNRFDMSFSASIQYVDNMILMTDAAIGDLMGISQPRKGDILPQDQVGTQQQSKIQSELRTEVYFTDFEEIEKRATAALLNLYAKYCVDEGDIIELIGEDLSYQYVEIPKGMLDKYDFSTMLSSGRKQEQALQEIKLIAKQYSDQGRLPIHAFINMYFAESIVELQKMAEYYARSTEEAMQQAQQEAGQAQAEAMQRVEQMKSELALKLKEIETQLKEKDLQLKAGIEESKAAMDKAKLDHEKERWDDEKQLKLMEIVNQDKIETAVIEENREGRQTDQQLKALQTKLDAIFKMMQLQLQSKSEKDRHDEALKKIAVDKEKSTKKQVKEHVIDN